MKTIIITGGTQGLGFAIAEQFAKQKYRLLLIYHSNHKKALVAKRKLEEKYEACVHILQADIGCSSSKQTILKAIRSDSNTYCIVNNAGRYYPEPTDAQKKDMVMTKLNGTYNISILSEEVKCEHIINISSLLVANNSAAPFSTALQAGVESLTKYFAQKYKGKRTVNCVRPGYMKTSMTTGIGEEKMKQYLNTVPDKKYIELNSIAQIIFMLSQQTLLTGQIITADKGTTINTIK